MAGYKFHMGVGCYYYYFYDFLSWCLNSKFHSSLKRSWNHPAILLVKVMGNLTCHLAISWGRLTGSLGCSCLEDNKRCVIAHADEESIRTIGLRVVILVNVNISSPGLLKLLPSLQVLSGVWAPPPTWWIWFLKSQGANRQVKERTEHRKITYREISWCLGQVPWISYEHTLVAWTGP